MECNRPLPKTIKHTFPIFIFCFMALASNAAQPNFWIRYSASYNQVGNNTQTLDAENPYNVSGECNTDSLKIIKAELKTPSGIVKTFAKAGDKKGSFHFDYVNLTELSREFPTGNYTLTIQTASGNVTKTSKFYAPQFPKAPIIRAGNNTNWFNNYLYVLDKDQPCSISWAPPDKQIDRIDIRLTDYSDNDFFSQTLSKNATRFEIPLSALNPMTQEKIYATVSFNSSTGGDISTTTNVYKEIFNPFQIVIAHSFIQSDNATNIPEWKGNSTAFYYDHGPYSVSIYGGRSGIVNGPNGKKIPIKTARPDGDSYCSGPIQNKAALDTAFPEGTYSIGQQSATLKGSAYPNSGSPIKITSVNGNLPRWSKGKLILNPKIKNVIAWTPFNITPDEFKYNGEIYFEVRREDNGVQFTEKKAGPVNPYDQQTPFNTYTFEANDLISNCEYLIRIKYFLASSIDIATNSSGAYSIATYAWVAAE